VSADSLWRNGTSSPAVNSAVGSYPFVVTDMDGQSRSPVFDAGADEYSTDPAARRPVRKDDVGPNAIVTDVKNEAEKKRIPESFAVVRNFPNPFNPSTTIEFTIPVSGRVALKVYNGAGELIEEIFDADAEADMFYRFLFDGSRIASGMYFTELHYNGSVSVRKMLLLK
jgi:hypothetical protein